MWHHSRVIGEKPSSQEGIMGWHIVDTQESGHELWGDTSPLQIFWLNFIASSMSNSH